MCRATALETFSALSFACMPMASASGVSMNHIARLTTDRAQALEQLSAARALVLELEAYLLSAKFAGPDNDYVHVRTDLLPKLAHVRSALVTD